MWLFETVVFLIRIIWILSNIWLMFMFKRFILTQQKLDWFLGDREHWSLTLSRRRPLSYRNQSIDLQSKSMDWFLYANALRHERVNGLIVNGWLLISYDRVQVLKSSFYRSVMKRPTDTGTAYWYYEWTDEYCERKNEYCEWVNEYYKFYEWSNEYYEWPHRFCKYCEWQDGFWINFLLPWLPWTNV